MGGGLGLSTSAKKNFGYRAYPTVFGDGTIRAGGGSEDGVVDFAVDDIHGEMLRRAFSC
jgi:hypothetical protein